jgi:hypothetical protein
MSGLGESVKVLASVEGHSSDSRGSGVMPPGTPTIAAVALPISRRDEWLGAVVLAVATGMVLTPIIDALLHAIRQGQVLQALACGLGALAVMGLGLLMKVRVIDGMRAGLASYQAWRRTLLDEAATPLERLTAWLCLRGCRVQMLGGASGARRADIEGALGGPAPGIILEPTAVTLLERHSPDGASGTVHRTWPIYRVVRRGELAFATLGAVAVPPLLVLAVIQITKALGVWNRDIGQWLLLGMVLLWVVMLPSLLLLLRQMGQLKLEGGRLVLQGRRRTTPIVMSETCVLMLNHYSPDLKLTSGKTKDVSTLDAVILRTGKLPAMRVPLVSAAASQEGVGGGREVAEFITAVLVAIRHERRG